MDQELGIRGWRRCLKTNDIVGIYGTPVYDYTNTTMNEKNWKAADSTDQDQPIIRKYLFDGPDEEDYIDPIEISGQFEGDILLRIMQERNAIRSEDLKWPDGRVPYSLPLFYGVRGRIMIALAVSEFARNTCIRFVPRTNETDYVAVFRGGGCYSMVGRMGGKQELSLANPCDQVGIVIHEFMHAIGFWHEQSRLDRDDYVTIRWENIASGTEGNFQKYDSYIQQTLDEDYDYSSVLHYSRRAFSKNGRNTIEPKNIVGSFMIGQRFGFSQTDVRKINKLYNCTNYL